MLKIINLKSILICLIIVCNIVIIKTQTYDDSNYDDDDDDLPHQLVIFGVDGLMGSKSTPRYMPFIYNMVSRAGGVYTSKARTVQTSYSKPGWISIFYAATPSEYGCKDNFKCNVPSDTSGFKSILDILEYEYNYSIQIHAEHDVIDHAFGNKRSVIKHNSWTKSMMEYASSEQNLPQTNKRVLFFHFNSVDHIGHSLGYGSHNYDASVMCVDWQISQMTMKLWEWEPERTTFLLVSDHGGLNYEHDTFDLESLQVPIAMWGYGVAKHVNLFSNPMDNIQVSPTLLYILDYEIPEYWKHKPVEKCKDTTINQNNKFGIYLDDAKQSMINSTHSVEELTICPIPHDSSHRGYKYTSVVVIISFVFGFLLLQNLINNFLKKN